MKRYIRSTSIFGMSMDRASAISRLKSLGSVFYEHICKCVLFGDSLHCYKHWVDEELANWISQANDLTLKGNKKLKSKYYQEYFFSGLGDSYSDARINLTAFMLDHRGKYPDVRTDAYIQNMYEVSRNIVSTFPNLLASKNSLTQRDFIRILHNILDRSCLEER